MKYGRIVYNDMKNDYTMYTNVGDWFQTFAVDNLYRIAGVSQNDIIEINRCELKTYRGEKVVVILQGWFNKIGHNDVFPLSPDIIPIYIGLHRTQKLNIKSEDFQNGCFVGCRDYATYKMFKKKGINAYISGCSTITFPQRQKISSQTDLFLVDVPESIYQYIPKKWEGRMHVISHEIEKTKTPESDAVELLKLYRDKAALIVTSRLHCAAPCLGMGIPVILVREYYDSRYDWIDKFLKLYEPKDFDKINWDVMPKDISNIKDILQNIVKAEIKKDNATLEQEVAICHDFYSEPRRKQFYAPWYVRCFWFLLHHMPRLSNFIRFKLLKRFTVMGGNQSNIIMAKKGEKK